MKTLFTKTTHAKNVYFFMQTHVPKMKKFYICKHFVGALKRA